MDEPIGVSRYLVPMGFIELEDRAKDFLKSRPSPRVLRRKVSAGEEGPRVRREKHAEGPAPSVAHRGHGLLVSPVHIGPLVPVELYRDEIFVKYPYDFLVIEGLLS